jgi:hypothetical protein
MQVYRMPNSAARRVCKRAVQPRQPMQQLAASLRRSRHNRKLKHKRPVLTVNSLPLFFGDSLVTVTA